MTAGARSPAGPAPDRQTPATAAAALVLFDPDGGCVYAAGDTEALFDHARLALVGRHVGSATAGQAPFPAVRIGDDVALTVRSLPISAALAMTVVLARRPAAPPAPTSEDGVALLAAVTRAVSALPVPAAVLAGDAVVANAAARQAFPRGLACASVRDGDVGVAILPVATGGDGAPVRLLVALAPPRSPVDDSQSRLRRLRLSALLEPGPDGMLVVDVDGRVLHASRAVRNLVGWHGNTGWRGSDWARLEHGGDLGRFCADLQGAGPGERRAARWELRAADESWVAVEVTVTNLLDDPGVGAIVAHVDERAGRVESDPRRLAALVEATSDAIVQADVDGTVRYWNAGAERLFGQPRTEAVGRVADVLLPPGAGNGSTLAARLVASGGLSFVVEHTRPDGAVVHASVALSPLTDGAGRLAGMTAVARDVSDAVRAAADRRRVDEEKSRRTSQHAIVAALSQRALDGTDLGALYREAADAVASTLDVPVVHVHELIDEGSAARRVAGHGWPGAEAPDDSRPVLPRSPIEVLLHHGGTLASEDLARETRFTVAPSILDNGLVSGAAVIVPGHEQAVGVLSIMSRVARRFHGDELNFLQAVANIVGTAIDRTRATEEMRHQALHDPLTGLPNRSLLIDRLDHALAVLDRRPGHVAVLFADLDHFKRFNDTLGHAVGDELLVTVARRVRQVVREGDTVARLGGDEFVVLCEELSDTTEAELIADRIRESLREPVRIGDQQIVLTVSIGMAVGDVASTAEDLLRRSDLAMYQAKADGRGVVRVFAPAMDVHVGQRLAAEQALRQALRDRDLDVVFTPRIRLTDGLVVGVEAAVRWHDGERGAIAPEEIITMADELGLLASIVGHVLDGACAAAATLRHAYPGLVVAIMLPGRQILHPDLLDLVRAALNRHDLEPDRLVIEVDSAVLEAESTPVASVFRSLRRIGVRLGIDHLGSGWAALRSLTGLAVDELKVDRALVRDLDDPGAATVVASMISVARAVGLRLVADGVETIEQVETLRRLHCSSGQGPFWAPAFTFDELEGWLENLDGLRVSVR